MSRDGRFEEMKKNVKVKHLCYLKLMMFVIKDLVLRHLLFKLATKQLTVKSCLALRCACCCADACVQSKKHHTSLRD